MVRRMADPQFRAQQQRDRYAPHVRAVNELVDALHGADGRGWLPHVAPWHGGVHARVLSVLRDPGPKTQVEGGSGFLCTENDDASAERQARLFDQVGVCPRELLPWNAYPWYINKAPTPRQLQAGVDPVLRLVQLLPGLRVVLLQVATYHPSRQALFHADRAVRALREQDRVQAYQRVAELLT
ncbi:uracil-DNA glycosylase [Rhodococcus sp. X156]|uniref:uracil-DNA glycosylase n=1 Tax=Rhodococcus sp. X156 TaxID=2499145 RepID=UPI000FDA755C|nr:uracil-DNA glycosylase [Rhodococcus sp. X156]